MTAFKLTKRMVFEAVLIVDAKNGLDAAEKLYAWRPTTWNQREEETSSEPYVEREEFGNGWTEERPVYEVRACRGHFHVTCCGEDITVDGDPFPTRGLAEVARLREAYTHQRVPASALPADTPTRTAPNET